MVELSIGQRDTIRLAYRAAEKTGNDAVIQGRVRQLAKDFKISEEEVLSIAKGLKAAPPAAPPPKVSGKRIVWTTGMLTQLKALRAQDLGPTAIAGQMGLEPNQVQQKLHLLKKRGALREPDAAGKPAHADPAYPPLPAPVEAPAAKSDSEIPAAAPASALGPRDLLEALKKSLPPAEEPPAAPAAPEAPATPDKEIPARDPEYESALAKLADPEPDGINLVRELLNLVDHFEVAYSAKARLLQANPSAGWASCSFDAAGRRYSVSLREKKERDAQ